MISGKNLSAFLIVISIMAGYIFPLGYALGRLVWNDRGVSRIIGGLGLGLAAVVTVWSWLAWLAVPVTPIIFLGALGAITLALFLVPSPDGQSPPARQSGYWIAAAVLGVIGFWFVSQILINAATPAADGQLHGFLQMLIKQTGRFHPLPIYPQESPLANLYPPGFQIICVINSRLSGISLPVTILGTTAAAYMILSLFLLEVLHKQGSRLWIAGLGVILVFSKGMQHLLATAQYPEIMAMIPCLGFVFFLDSFLKKNDWKNCLLSGWLAGAAGLIHTRFLFWLVCALTLYLLSRYLADPKPTGKEQLGLAAIIIVSLSVNLPIWWINAKSLAVGAGHIYVHPLVSALELVKFQGVLFTVITVSAIALNLFRRDRLSVFLLTWVLVMIVLADYWRVLRFISPSWFAIDYTTRPFGNFKDLFSFTNPWSALNYGLFPLVPLAFVRGVSGLTLSGKGKEYAARLARYKTGLLVGLTFLGGLYFYSEISGLHLNRWKTLPLEDLQVLTKLKQETDFPGTFLFNPRDRLSGWAPVVAERRALFFKSNYFFGREPYLIPRKRINKVFLNLGRHYRFLKENKFNYIYVPSSWADRFDREKRASFLRLEYQVGRARIYRVL